MSANSAVCVPGVPATSQIPRLLNRQYEAVVRDLLGVTGVGTDNKPPSQLLVADSDGPMTPDAWRIYQDVGGQIAHAVMTGPNKSKFIGCDPAAAGCLEQTIRDLRAQGVPPAVDRRGGRALPEAEPDDARQERPTRSPRRRCSPSSCRPRSCCSPS